MTAETTRVEELWRRYAGPLLSYAVARVGDRALAEDALQTVFARLLERGLPPGAREAAYLFRAVHNEALNSARSGRREAARRAHCLGLPAGDPADAAEREELRGRVEEALDALPPEQREAVVLKIWGELSFQEIGDVVGAGEDAAEHRYYRGLAALERSLGRRQ